MNDDDRAVLDALAGRHVVSLYCAGCGGRFSTSCEEGQMAGTVRDTVCNRTYGFVPDQYGEDVLWFVDWSSQG
jgi:hypothetical protein